MDSAYPNECWISEPDSVRFSLNSPALSSGYCSAEETLHSKYSAGGGPGDSSSSSSTFRGQRDVDSPWRGQSPSLALSSTTNPCLGSGDLSSGMITVSSQDSLPDLKNSLSFDDLMDTLYDPFGDGARMNDFSACDTLTDIEMTDTDCCMFLSRGASTGVNQSVVGSSVNSDCSLVNLLKTQELVAINVNQSNGRFGTAGVSPNPASQLLGVNSAAGKYVAVPVRSSLPMDQQSSNSVVNVSRSSGLCSTVSSLHQHMADMNDMSAATGDASDYVLRFVPKNNAQSQTVEAIIKHPVTAAVAPPAHNSVILGGVFNQRGTLRTCEPKALGRIKGGTVATSCGSLLRHSVSIPNSMNTSSIQASVASKENGKPMLESKVRNGIQAASTKTNNCDRVISSCDMRGGRATSAYPGLDDHRYTLKQVPSNQNVSKLRKSGGAHASNPSFSGGGQEGCMLTMGGGATSILEAFLRSTRPMDPNKGSNAALAAEGLSYLRLDERQTKEKPESPGPGGGGCGGMLLKKLLTGEIDQGQALMRQTGGGDEQLHEGGEMMIHDRLLCPSLPIDSPLTDGFGLDVDLSLDDSQMMGLGLMGGTDIPDITESIWLGDLADQLEESELDEILREQTRQEDLWAEHYVNHLV